MTAEEVLKMVYDVFGDKALSDYELSRFKLFAELAAGKERVRCARVCKALDFKEKCHGAAYGAGYLTYSALDCAEHILKMDNK